MRASAKDAIVVLGCRVADDGSARGALRRRCLRAARAFHDGLAPRVIVCGGKRWRGHVEADVMRRTLVELGVPAGAIHQERQSLSTWGNARHGGLLLRRLGVTTILVSTCDFHQTRALRAFRQAGFDAIGLSSDSGRAGSAWRRRLWEAVLAWATPEVPCSH